MSLAESLNWEQEEQCTSVFPRSVTNRKNQENLKLSEKKELLKKIADILAEEKWITSAELLVLKEKIENALKKYLVPGMAEHTRIAFARHRNDAGMLGAFYHFCSLRRSV